MAEIKFMKQIKVIYAGISERKGMIKIMQSLPAI
jgi:hypothetical protein